MSAKRVVLSLVLLLGIVLSLVGCREPKYSIVLSYEPGVGSGTATGTSATARGVSTERPEYMPAYISSAGRIIATVYDGDKLVTDGVINYTTSTPETLDVREDDDGRSVYVGLKNHDLRHVSLTAVYTPTSGDPVVRTHEFAVAYSAWFNPGEGIDFDTRVNVGTVFEGPHIVPPDDPAVTFAVLSSTIDDSAPDCNDWIWALTISAPYGYMTVYNPEIPVLSAFAEYEEYPTIDLTETEFVSDNFTQYSNWTFFVVESAAGKKYKVVLSGYIDYQELLPPEGP